MVALATSMSFAPSDLKGSNQMHTKIITACLAIAAFAAFGAAPSASASNLTESGVTVKAGASITGTSTLIRFIAGSNTLACTHAHMSGTVTADASGTIAAEIAAFNPVIGGTDTGTDCTSSGLGPVKWTVNSRLCLHVPNKTDFGTVTGCAGAPLTFTLNLTNLTTLCHYEKATLGVEITTAPVDAAVRARPGEVAKGEFPNSIFCPAEGELEMEFTLTTTDGTTLIFS